MSFSLAHTSRHMMRTLGRVAALTMTVGSLVGGAALLSGNAPAGAKPIAATRYVSPYGSDTGNSCTSKSSPCQTLKHAVNESNSGDTINLAPGTYVGDIEIDENLTIVGTLPSGSLDANNTTINAEGDPSYKYGIAVLSGVVTISDLVINGGYAPQAGGIYNDGELSLDNVTLQNNIDEEGGGIYNADFVQMTGGSITGNQAEYGGGFFNDGKAIMQGVTFSHNIAGFDGAGEGGAIFNEENLTLSGTTPIHNNSASLDGGGIFECTGSGNKIGGGTSNTANTPNDVASEPC
jgi:hypothetical protein